MVPWSELIEAESPISTDKEESEEKSEEKLVARSFVLRSLFNPHNRNRGRMTKKAVRLCNGRSQAAYLPSIVGHQLVNGLRAPMLI